MLLRSWLNLRLWSWLLKLRRRLLNLQLRRQLRLLDLRLLGVWSRVRNELRVLRLWMRQQRWRALDLLLLFRQLLIFYFILLVFVLVIVLGNQLALLVHRDRFRSGSSGGRRGRANMQQLVDGAARQRLRWLSSHGLSGHCSRGNERRRGLVLFR